MAHTSLEGRWLRVNRRLCEFLGYSPEELMATSFMAVTHPDDLEQDTREMARLLAGATAKYEREKRYCHKGGHFVSATLTAVLHRDAEGAPKYFISTIADVTERIRLEGQLRQGQKMEAIGRLAGDCARPQQPADGHHGYADLIFDQIAPGTAVCRPRRDSQAASAAGLTRQLRVQPEADPAAGARLERHRHAHERVAAPADR